MGDNQLIAPAALASRLAAADEAYIRSAYVPLSEVAGPRLDEVRAAMDGGRLPAAAYVLDDGTEMVAHDHLAFADEVGADVRGAFRARYTAACGPDADGAWIGYLSGGYAICLRTLTPEAIARKDRLTGEIERPFAPLDEHRFGTRPTRHRLIDDPRARWDWLAP